MSAQCPPEDGALLIDASDVVAANDGFIRNSDWAMGNIALANSAIDALRAGARLPLDDKDDVTILRLGIRLINSAGAGGAAALSGYYQPAAAHIRDIIEVGLLLDLFRRDRSQVLRWRDADDKRRWKEFQPRALRNRLDKIDGGGTTYRNDAYKFFSTHGTHPHPRAVVLMSPDMQTIIGPFPDQQRIIGLSFDLARHLAAGALYLLHCIDARRLDSDQPVVTEYLRAAISFVDAIDAFRKRTPQPGIPDDPGKPS